MLTDIRRKPDMVKVKQVFTRDDTINRCLVNELK